MITDAGINFASPLDKNDLIAGLNAYAELQNNVAVLTVQASGADIDIAIVKAQIEELSDTVHNVVGVIDFGDTLVAFELHKAFDGRWKPIVNCTDTTKDKVQDFFGNLKDSVDNLEELTDHDIKNVDIQGDKILGTIASIYIGIDSLTEDTPIVVDKYPHGIDPLYISYAANVCITKLNLNYATKELIFKMQKSAYQEISSHQEAWTLSRAFQMFIKQQAAIEHNDTLSELSDQLCTAIKVHMGASWNTDEAAAGYKAALDEAAGIIVVSAGISKSKVIDLSENLELLFKEGVADPYLLTETGKYAPLTVEGDEAKTYHYECGATDYTVNLSGENCTVITAPHIEFTL